MVSDLERLLRGIRDPRVLAAFSKVDRACFVPSAYKLQAWADHPLPLEDGATISQPSLVAEMTALLDLQASSRVLEIGTGSGYQTALLAELAARVFTVEISPLLWGRARASLTSLGYVNIAYKRGDGSRGWPEEAPFDRIISTVAFTARPMLLLDQLTSNGICIAPVGPRDGTQWLMLYRSQSDGISEKLITPVRFLSIRSEP